MSIIKLNILLFLLFFLYYIYYVEATIITALAFAVNEKERIYTNLINNFNIYSRSNHLDITIHLDLFTSKNATTSTDNYCSVIDSLLKKKSDKYDIYFYDNIYTPRFEPHFLDLNKWLPKEHISMFRNIENSELFSYKNKLIGLPIYINFSYLAYNKELLKKYNKNVPVTWDELLETGKYILDQEKKQNNTDILIYHGSFIDDELGMSSLYEFIYSFRDSIDSSFPDLRSQNAINALKMIKKIKNEVSSDIIYRNIRPSLEKLVYGNGLFIRYHYLAIPYNKSYGISILPGYKKGISSSLISGYNIGLNSYTNEERQKKAVEVLLYMTSKDVQRQLIIDNKVFSGIASLYNEKEICEINNICYLYNNAQPVVKPTSISNDYNEYSEKFRHYAYKYIYGEDDVDPAEMLRKIDDITRIYHISIKSEYSNIGVIIAIVYGVITLIFILTSVFLCFEKYNLCFRFLPKDFYFLILIGYVVYMLSSFMELEKVTIPRCHLYLFFQLTSFIFNFIPVLQKLICIFPVKNKISHWTSCHPYLFNIIFIVFDLLVNGMMLIQPYQIKNIIVSNGKNFQICRIGGLLSNVLFMLIYIFRILMILCVLFLSLIERNNKLYSFDIYCCISTYSLNVLFVILLAVFDYININHYIAHFLTREVIMTLNIINNYFFFYVIKLIYYKLNKNYLRDYYIEKNPQDLNDLKSSNLKKSNSTSEMTNNNKFENFLRFLKRNSRDEIISSKYNVSIITNKSIPFTRNHFSEIQSSEVYYDKISISRDFMEETQFKNSVIPSKVRSSNISSINESDISQLKNIISNNVNDISSSEINLLSSNSNISSSSSNDVVISNEELNNLMMNQEDITTKNNKK